MKYKKVLSDKEELEICENYKNGSSYHKLSKKYNCATKTIEKILIKYDLIYLSHVRKDIKIILTPEVASIILTLWYDKWSVRKLAVLFNYSTKLIISTLNKYGITDRHRGYSGRIHCHWTGKRQIDKSGYYWIHILPEDEKMYEELRPMFKGEGRIREHRYVMAKHLSRCLSKDEDVHHIDGDKSNNNLENLQLRRGKHGSKNCFQCRNCGSQDIISVPIKEVSDAFFYQI